ncbi:MAG TPA: DUF6596 domain-containing protein [Gemmatimonadales bacterium]
MELHEDLFRHEAGRMTAALTRLFGMQNLALAEDVVQDAFCRALELWPRRGVPPNPAAWLMTTARNRALDVIRQQRTASTFAPEIARLLDSEWTAAALVDEAFTPALIRDELLRMIFACCHPDLPESAQIALVLNILCGFGAPEIAAAFLERRSAIEKRITRGKKVLASTSRLTDLRAGDLAPRLAAVHRTLYLLFNEGYHGSSSRGVVRAQLCEEAIRLVTLLGEHEATAVPATFALGALMLLHAARLPARLDAAGDLIALWDQDRQRWDRDRIAQGRALLDRSASGTALSSYHVEAAIAAVHVGAASVAATDWRAIVELYDQLMVIAPSPVVALNRAVSLAERDGPPAGIAALQELDGDDRLAAYPFFPAARGELESRLGRTEAAARYFEEALRLARNDGERRFLERKLERLRS